MRSNDFVICTDANFFYLFRSLISNFIALKIVDILLQFTLTRDLIVIKLTA